MAENTSCFSKLGLIIDEIIRRIYRTCK